MAMYLLWYVNVVFHCLSRCEEISELFFTENVRWFEHNTLYFILYFFFQKNNGQRRLISDVARYLDAKFLILERKAHVHKKKRSSGTANFLRSSTLFSATVLVLHFLPSDTRATLQDKD